ncbi:hypothetical protein ACTWPT_39155 [Nonomuraea sp. 3N208]|uniref:hypothetical protein n=1 Tax=Nonomuraea sp. 3N208 TaxID=3457421 RepID=UPI003FD54596
MSVTQFPLTLRVTVSGATPDEIKENAMAEAHAFFGPGAELNVISADAESEGEQHHSYRATVAFRRIG